MARKKDHITRIKQSQLVDKARELHAQGYSILMPNDQSYIEEFQGVSWADFIGSQLRSGSTITGTSQRNSIPSLYFSSGNENMQGTDNIGTQGLGWMEWGFGNSLPNLVAFLTYLQPYTATGLKFNTDLCAGLGPQPMYDTAQYVGGKVTTRFIRYKDAGTFLRGQIIDKQRELLKLISEKEASLSAHPDGASSGDANPSVWDYVPETDKASKKIFDDLKASLEEQIKELQDALEQWKRTEPELHAFIQRNNIAQTWLSLTLDQELFGISFPELQLNQQDLDKDGKPVTTDKWNPKVVGLSHRSCHTTRMERMDSHNRINYVYCSNRWLDAPFVDLGDVQQNIYALPCLNMASPLVSLEEHIRNARQSRVAVSKRPTRFVMPSVYPTAGRPYYPTPAWHSIFGGDIYEYISTIISDRLSRKRNSSIIGRVIYIHHDYLKQLFTQAGITGDAKKMDEIRQKLFSQINTWLSNRSNAGQSLLAFTFTGSDGKEHKSFEIVEIAANNKSSADANEKETAEISSVVFMAMGLDARLLGSSPLSLVGSNGGTDIRERYLLRLILKSPTQKIMLKTLDVVSSFNKWDKHLVWQIQREVMTTLDRSKSGVTSQSSDDTVNS